MTHSLVTRQGPFRQPGRWMFWLYLALVGVAIVGMAPATVFLPAAAAPSAVGAWLVFNLPIAVVWILVIRWLDLFEKEPIPLMAAAFVWGAAIGEFAGIANDAITELTVKLAGAEFSSAWSAAIAAPITEEVLKGLGVLVVILIGREHVQRPMDGLIYGAMSGLGFGVVENLTYALNTAQADPNEDLVPAVFETFGRAVAGTASGHALLSAIVGLGIGYAVTMTNRPLSRRLLVAVGLFAVGWGLHFVWNSPIFSGLGFGGKIVKAALEITCLVLAYRYAARREFDWFASTMRNEAPDVITAEEVQTLRTLRGRRQARRLARRHFDWRRGGLLRRLHEKQLAVASVKSNSTDPDHDPAVEEARNKVRVARAALAQR